MNRLLTTIFVASAAGMCMAADVSDQIEWYAGPFSSKQTITNMTVTSLGQLNGVFADGTQFQMNGDNFKAQTSGPDGYTYTSTINQAMAYDYNTGGVVGQPAFQFRAAASKVEAPGEYTVTIPAGAFKVNGADNDAFSVNFTIKDNRTYTPVDLGFSANPDPLIEQTELLEMTVTFNNLDANDKPIYQNLGASPTVKPTIVKVGTNDAKECEFVSTSTTTGRIGYKVKFPDGAIDGPAKYKVVIPEGAIRLSSQSNGNYYTNTEASYIYTYTGTGSQEIAVADQLKWYYGTAYDRKLPVDGTLQGLSILFGMLEDGRVLRVKSGRPNATITGPEGYSKTSEIVQVRTYDAASQQTVDVNGFRIDGTVNSVTVTVPGEYTVTIPAGTLTINGYDNAAFTAKFTVKDSRTYEPTDFNYDVRPSPNDPEIISLTYFQIFLSANDSQGNRIYRPLGVKHNATATIAKAGGATVELPFVSNESVTTGNIGYRIAFSNDLSFKNGVYTVTIPEGTMLIGSETSSTYYTNKELKYVYKFAGSSDTEYTSTLPTITPAQGGSLKGFAGVMFESPSEDLLMRPGKDVTGYELTLPNGTTTKHELITAPNGMMINIPFYQTYMEPGQYRLTVPRDGLIYVDYVSGTEYHSNGFELVYNVTGGQIGDMEYTLSSQTGTINNDRTDVYNMDYVFVKFAEEVTPVDMIYSKVVYPDGTTHYARTTWSGGANQRFMINFNYPKTLGLYKVTVPAGACYNAEGKFNQEFSFELNYIDRSMVDIPCTVDPENGSFVSSLKTINIFAPADFTEIYGTNGGITMTYFYNNDDPEHREMQYLKTVTPTNMSIVLDEEVTKVGDYTWYIPADAIRGKKTDGTQVVGNAMSFFWSIREGGIVNAVSDGADTLFTVYTLDGTLVMNKVTNEDLNRLPKGTYIINGRTYILR